MNLGRKLTMSYQEYVRRVVPYVPGEQPKEENIIKLNTNENPYPPAPAVETILGEVDSRELRLYPDPEATDLVEAIAGKYHVDKKQVFVGVGSDDVLAMAFLTFFNSHKPILFPDVTYSFYDVWADLFRIPYEKCPLNEQFQICSEDYKRENGGIIFPNPNAPTGVLQSLDEIEEILQANLDVVVMVDEAYIDFGGESALSLIDKYNNLLVIQTFSKSRSLAGLRIGYAIGNQEMIQYLNDVKFSFNSYTMNRLTIRLGVEAIKDDAYFQAMNQKIIHTRERVKAELIALGFEFPDSKANFIFATHKFVKAVEIFEDLKRKHIFVRYFNKTRIDNYLRITIGTEEEMTKFLETLKQILDNKERKGMQ